MTRAGLSRAAVVRAGAELADEQGLRQVTLSDLARRLGVRAPSLYSHVGGVEELRAEVTVLALDELAERGDRALAGLAGRAALAALAEVHRGYAREHPGRFEAAGALDLPVTDELARAGARHSAQALAVLRGYDVTEAERAHAVRVVAGLLRGLAQLEGGGAFAHRADPTDDTWSRAVAALDLALRQWGQVSAPA